MNRATRKLFISFDNVDYEVQLPATFQWYILTMGQCYGGYADWEVKWPLSGMVYSKTPGDMMWWL